jgi:hypothetical protein
MAKWGARAEGDGWSAEASGDKQKDGGGGKGCLVMFCILSSGMLIALGAVAWSAYHLVLA